MGLKFKCTEACLEPGSAEMALQIQSIGAGIALGSTRVCLDPVSAGTSDLNPGFTRD